MQTTNYSTEIDKSQRALQENLIEHITTTVKHHRYDIQHTFCFYTSSSFSQYKRAHCHTVYSCIAKSFEIVRVYCHQYIQTHSVFNCNSVVRSKCKKKKQYHANLVASLWNTMNATATGFLQSTTPHACTVRNLRVTPYEKQYGVDAHTFFHVFCIPSYRSSYFI